MSQYPKKAKCDILMTTRIFRSGELRGRLVSRRLMHVCLTGWVMGSPQARLVWFGLPCQVASQIILAFFTRSTKIEKEKKEHAKLHGMIRTEISGAEIAEEMEKERRLFQLQMCEVRAGGCRFLRGAGSQLGGGGCCLAAGLHRVSTPVESAHFQRLQTAHQGMIGLHLSSFSYRGSLSLLERGMS